jgi:hypothetical protein
VTRRSLDEMLGCTLHRHNVAAVDPGSPAARAMPSAVRAKQHRHRQTDRQTRARARAHTHTHTPHTHSHIHSNTNARCIQVKAGDNLIAIDDLDVRVAGHGEIISALQERGTLRRNVFDELPSTDAVGNSGTPAAATTASDRLKALRLQSLGQQRHASAGSRASIGSRSSSHSATAAVAGGSGAVGSRGGSGSGVGGNGSGVGGTRVGGGGGGGGGGSSGSGGGDDTISMASSVSIAGLEVSLVLERKCSRDLRDRPMVPLSTMDSDSVGRLLLEFGLIERAGWTEAGTAPTRFAGSEKLCVMLSPHHVCIQSGWT